VVKNKTLNLTKNRAQQVFPSNSNALHRDSGLYCPFEDHGSFAIYFCTKNKMLNTQSVVGCRLKHFAKWNHPRLSVQEPLPVLSHTSNMG